MRKTRAFFVLLVAIFASLGSAPSFAASMQDRLEGFKNKLFGAVASVLSSEPTDLKEFGNVVYTFANGNKITIVTDGADRGLYWGEGLEARKRPLLLGMVSEMSGGAKIISNKGVPKQLLQDPLDSLGGKTIVAYFNRVPYLISQNGRVVALPVMAHSRVDDGGSPRWHYRTKFEYGGHTYFGFQYLWKETLKYSDRQLSGEFYIIRDDGLFTRQLFSREDDKLVMSVADGILSTDTYYRQLDLDRFEMEASFNVTAPRTATDANSKDDLSGIDAWGKIATLFRRIPPSPRPLILDQTGQRIVAGSVAALTLGQTSAVILGDPGSGKSLLAEQVVNYLPRTWMMMKLTTDSINSSARWTGNFSSRILAIKAVSDYRPVIWLMDEVHSFSGLGRHASRDVDVFEELKTEMGDGSVRILGNAVRLDYLKMIEQNPALDRRMEKILHTGYTDEEIDQHIRNWLSERNLPQLSEELRAELRKQAGIFEPLTAEPARSIGILKSLFLNWESGSVEEVTQQDLTDAIQRRYSIPIEFVDFNKALAKLDILKTELARQLPGNEEARNQLFNAAARSLLNIRRQDRPRASGVFAGPKGVGKTQLLKVYKDILGLDFIRVAMNQFTSPYDVEKFLQVVGPFWSAHPFGIVLFDEPDKASKEVQEALLEALESREFSYTKKGQDYNTETVRVTVVNGQAYFATNAGQSLILEAARAGRKVSGEALKIAMTQNMSDLLTDRMDFAVAMYPATPENFKKIVEMELHKAVEEVGIPTTQILNWPDMVEALAARQITAGSNRLASELANTAIRDSVVRMLTDREVPSKDALSRQKYLFDSASSALVLVKEAASCQVAVTSAVVPFQRPPPNAK